MIIKLSNSDDGNKFYIKLVFANLDLEKRIQKKLKQHGF